MIRPPPPKQRPRIPYQTIFIPDKIDSVYLDDLPIDAKIINYEETSFIFSPYIYHIELNHGHFNWIIKRRFNQFRQLHNQIRLFYTKLAIPLPTQNSRQNRKILERMGEIEWPKFPVLPEMFYIGDGISRRIVSEFFFRIIFLNSFFLPNCRKFLKIIFVFCLVIHCFVIILHCKHFWQSAHIHLSMNLD